MLFRQAILYPNSSPDEATAIRWHEPGGESAAVPDLAGLNYVNLASRRQPDHLRAESRSAHRLLEKSAALERCLGLPRQTFLPAAICETFETSGQQQIDSYIKARFESERAYFLHFRGTEDLGKLKSADTIRFVTGPCLFSSRMLEAREAGGGWISLLSPRSVIHTRLAAITVDDRMSLYELEGCVRQARLIADMAGALPRETQLSVVLDVPREQYYLYLLEGLASGLVPKDLMVKWVAMVDSRHERVERALKDQMEFWFARAGLSTPTLTVSAGLKQVRGELLDAIERHRVPSTNYLVDKLASFSPVWSFIKDAAPPSSLRELGYYSYSVEYLAGMSQNESLGEALCVGVEDRTEAKIFQGAKRIRKLMQQCRPGTWPAMLGLYAQPQVLLAGLNTSSLYLNDPGTRFSDDMGEYSSQELLEIVYGCSFASDASATMRA